MVGCNSSSSTLAASASTIISAMAPKSSTSISTGAEISSSTINVSDNSALGASGAIDSGALGASVSKVITIFSSTGCSAFFGSSFLNGSLCSKPVAIKVIPNF